MKKVWQGQEEPLDLPLLAQGVKFKSKILENASILTSQDRVWRAGWTWSCPRSTSSSTSLPSHDCPGLRKAQGKGFDIFKVNLELSSKPQKGHLKHSLKHFNNHHCQSVFQQSNPTHRIYYIITHTPLQKLKKIMVISISRGWSPSSEGAPSPEGETII